MANSPQLTKTGKQTPSPPRASEELLQLAPPPPIQLLILRPLPIREKPGPDPRTQRGSHTAVRIIQLHRHPGRIYKRLPEYRAEEHIRQTRPDHRRAHPILPHDIQPVPERKGNPFLTGPIHMRGSVNIQIDIQKLRADDPVAKDPLRPIPKW